MVQDFKIFFGKTEIKFSSATCHATIESLHGNKEGDSLACPSVNKHSIIPNKYTRSDAKAKVNTNYEEN